MLRARHNWNYNHIFRDSIQDKVRFQNRFLLKNGWWIRLIVLLPCWGSVVTNIASVFLLLSVQNTSLASLQCITFFLMNMPCIRPRLEASVQSNNLLFQIGSVSPLSRSPPTGVLEQNSFHMFSDLALHGSHKPSKGVKLLSSNWRFSWCVTVVFCCIELICNLTNPESSLQTQTD